MEPEDGVKSSVSLTNEKKSNEITVESPVISRNEKSTAGNCNDGRNENVNSQNQAGNINNILLGKCSFDDLLPLPKKVVRIFISSTFTDTLAERNALMQHVYPKLVDHCRQQYGLEFQVVDMRWGVPEQASDNHSTSQLCIQEIKKCQEVSVGPNFVALVGDKYGYRPIPSEIKQDVYEAMEKTAEDWQVVQDWYKLDENSIPPVYLLQPISSKIQHYNDKENAELRKASQDKWNEVNQSLTRALRKAASAACDAGKIDDITKQTFYVSVTENEISEGILWKEKEAEQTCYCIIRKIEDLDKHITEPKAYRFTDLTANKSLDNEARNLLNKLQQDKLIKSLPQSNLLQLDIEWLISGANVTVENIDSNTLTTAENSSNGSSRDTSKHGDYLDNICQGFFQTISKLVEDGHTKQKYLYDSLTAELLQHWHLAKARCEIFEGRQKELENIEGYLKATDSQCPLIVHGSSGCGKTSVMAKVTENIVEKKWSSTPIDKFTVLLRFLGTTPNTSNLHQLLDSLCRQICAVYGLKWEEPDEIKDLIEKFHELLGKSTSEKPLLLILDSIDQLMPAYNAFKLKWLPVKLPKHSKILISTIDEGYAIYKNFQDRYKDLKFTDVRIDSLGESLGLQVIYKWLSKDKRTMTQNQENAIKDLLLKCSLPLYARIAYDQIKRWKSYDTPTAEAIEPTVRGAIYKLFSSMEEKFGTAIVKHSLAYLTAARHGMSEAELEHVMSLDDLLLNEVFKLWIPPVRRVPPLLWTRVRTEIHSYVVERSADDILVLNWYHRQFIEATKAKYLSDAAFSSHIQDHLVQFFTGKWSEGKEKPFEYTDFQVKRFGLSSSKDAKDRKVPKQPYVTRYTVGDNVELRFNKRKLSEVPFHMIKMKRYDALKQNVFFNYEWLFAKLKSSSIQQLLEEFEIFMQADKVMKKDAEMKLLYANLQLMRPCLYKYTDSLPYEISGRLAKYIGSSKHITNLIKQCDTENFTHCPIIPMVTCFETANVGFSQNIKFRSTDSWIEGGAICCSNDFQSLYIMDYTNEGAPVILQYDSTSGEKVHTIPVQKPEEGTIDMYSKIVVSVNKKEIFAFYMQKSEGKTEKKFRDKYALIDVIEIETGKVLNTYEGQMIQKFMANPLLYMTENVICVDFIQKRPVIFYRTRVQKDLNKPSLLSADEKYFIVCDRDKTTLKEFHNKNHIGEFDVTEQQLTVAGTGDFSLVILVESKTYTIRLYDLSNKLQHTESGQSQQQTIIKAKKEVPVTDNQMRKTLDNFFAGITDEENQDDVHSRRQRATVVLSQNGVSFIVIFGSALKIPYLYSINKSNWNVKCIGLLNPSGDTISYRDRYPVFTHNGERIIFVKGASVFIIDPATGNTIHTYNMVEDIKDFCVSAVSSKIAVRLQKSVMMLDIAELKEDEESLLGVQKGNNNPAEQNTEKQSQQQLTEKVKQKKAKIKEILERCEEKSMSVLLHQETVRGQTQPELLLKVGDEQCVLEEVRSLAAYADTDRIASARSKPQHAIYKTFTPDGLKTLHYHSKVQVIDTNTENIVYTPRKGDVIQRTVMNNEGNSMNETIPIPGLETAESRRIELPLLNGDRIIQQDGNKIKFRVVQQHTKQFKIMNVPSVFSVYSVTELKLKKIQSITVFGENLLTVSNSHIVTSKKTKQGHFVNVFHIEEGKLLATHELKKEAQSARFSSDQMQLFVVDVGLCLTGYNGPMFNSMEIRIDLAPAGSYSIKEIYVFDVKRDRLVVSYNPEKASVFVETSYVSVDLATKSVSKEITIAPGFDDISESGTFGIDSKLSIYKLKTGTVKVQLPYGDSHERDEKSKSKDTMQLITRFVRDDHIIFIDKQDDTLHMYSIDGEKQTHLFSCFSHVPNLVPNSSSCMSVANRGHNLILRTGTKVLCFAIVTEQKQHDDDLVLVYKDERSRALSMMVGWCDEYQTTQLPATGKESIFSKRKLLVQSIKEEENAMDKPIVREFQKENPDKPQVLVVSESILSTYFNPAQFSKYLKTEKIPAVSAEVAENKIKALGKKYDVIILQLITDDVLTHNVDYCTQKVSDAVEAARAQARMVLLSLAPCRADGQELNRKTQEVNAKLAEKYKPVKDVHICNNDNLSSNGRPLEKYFQDGVCLSASGVKQICVNYKDVMLPILAEHYWVGQKHKPSLQTNNNKII